MTLFLKRIKKVNKILNHHDDQRNDSKKKTKNMEIFRPFSKIHVPGLKKTKNQKKMKQNFCFSFPKTQNCNEKKKKI